MNKPVISLLLIALFSPPLLAGDEAPPTGQLGFLDEGQVLTGPEDEWKERVDTLARLGFDFIGTTGALPCTETKEYIESRGLSNRHVLRPDDEQATPVEPSLRVLDERAQKTWAAGAADFPEGSELLWADDGSGGISAWPFDTRGFRFGVLLHAGGAHNGPFQDPYPGRIGETLSEAAKRGFTGHVLIAAPGIDAYLLNLEAAAAAHRDPNGFDGDAFYREWATRQFGKETAEAAPKSLKLLHGAHKHVEGFGSVMEASLKIVGDLEQGQAGTIDINPVINALRLSKRSRDLAVEALPRVSADHRDAFESRIIWPATVFVRNLELLESLSQLSNAWKIYNALPSGMSRQRVEGLLTQAHGRSIALRTDLGKEAGLPDHWTAAPERIDALSARLNEKGDAGEPEDTP